MSADPIPATSPPRRGPTAGARVLSILWGSLPALVFVALIALWWAAVEILKVPGTLSSLPDYSTPLSKWQSPTRFVFRCRQSGRPASPLSISTSWRDEMR